MSRRVSAGERKGSRGSALRLLCNRQDFWNGVVEDTRIRGGIKARRGATATGAESFALQYPSVWECDVEGAKARRDATATGAESLALQESVP